MKLIIKTAAKTAAIKTPETLLGTLGAGVLTTGIVKVLESSTDIISDTSKDDEKDKLIARLESKVEQFETKVLELEEKITILEAPCQATLGMKIDNTVSQIYSGFEKWRNWSIGHKPKPAEIQEAISENQEAISEKIVENTNSLPANSLPTDGITIAFSLVPEGSTFILRIFILFLSVYIVYYPIINTKIRHIFY
jgi:hypothetical protein